MHGFWIFHSLQQRSARHEARIEDAATEHVDTVAGSEFVDDRIRDEDDDATQA